MQEVIQACHKNDLFICPDCGKKRKYYCLGVCRCCYTRQLYWRSERYRMQCIEVSRKQVRAGYYSRRYYKKTRIGDVDTIRDICLDYNLRLNVANAIAMNGAVLDWEMRKRGIIK